MINKKRHPLSPYKVFLPPVGALAVVALFYYFYFSSKDLHTSSQLHVYPLESTERRQSSDMPSIVVEKYNQHEVRSRIYREKIARLTANRDKVRQNEPIDDTIRHPPLRNVQIFYHAPVQWFQSESSAAAASVFQRVYDNNSILFKSQNEELNVGFYPQRGFYKSNESILRDHFLEIHDMGVGVVILNWRPNLLSVDEIRKIFDLLVEYDLRVSIQINNYGKRTVESVRNNVKFFVDSFGNHPSFNKFYFTSRAKELPIFYIKDAFLLKDADYRKMLTVNGAISVRMTNYDAIFIGHISIKDDKSLIRRAGFDGFYTYLASNGAVYASTWKNWETIKRFCANYQLQFVPSVGPGYFEKGRSAKQGSSLRRYRSSGQYYGVAWRTALAINSPIVTISSYNNWPEGTQIESAIPRPGFSDYLPQQPRKYLELTKYWVDELYKLKSSKISQMRSCDDFLNSTIC